jgi:hypothetical protein
MRTEIRAGLGRSGSAALAPAVAGSETTVSKNCREFDRPSRRGCRPTRERWAGVPSPAYSFATTTKLSYRLSARPIPDSSWPGTSKNRRGCLCACS